MKKYLVDIQKENKKVIVYLPFDARKEFNRPKGTLYVKGSLNNVAFRNRLFSKGNGLYFMMINRDLQKELLLDEEIKKNVELIIEIDPISAPSETNYLPGEISTQSELNVLEAIGSRTSIRIYADKKIDERQINTILNAGFCAPSAQNKRPYHFIVIRDKEKLKKLSEGNYKAGMVPSASVCIMICGDKAVQGVNEFLVADCSAAAQNILLAAHGLNLGAVWCGVLFNSEWQKQLCKLFELPKKIVPISLISIGYPDEVKKTTERFENKKIHHEIW